MLCIYLLYCMTYDVDQVERLREILLGLDESKMKINNRSKKTIMLLSTLRDDQITNKLQILVNQMDEYDQQRLKVIRDFSRFHTVVHEYL